MTNIRSLQVECWLLFIIEFYTVITLKTNLYNCGQKSSKTYSFPCSYYKRHLNSRLDFCIFFMHKEMELKLQVIREFLIGLYFFYFFLN